MTHPLRGAIAAALLAAAPLVAVAQASAPAAAPSASGTAPAAKPAGYRSAFDGYRRFDEQKVQPWRDANDTVRRIGGWQAYARESAGDEAAPTGDHHQHQPAAGQAAPQAPAASTAGPNPAPAKAPAPAAPSSVPHGGHMGHGGHPMRRTP